MFASQPMWGQTIDELQKEIHEAENAIKRSNELLEENKSQQKSGLAQLSLVKSNIENRKTIISNLDKQIKLTQNGISSNNTEISSLNKDLKRMKEEYTKVLISSYKEYKLNNYFLFLFASKDFHDFFMRMYYLKKHTALRERKAKEIANTTSRIKTETESLQKKQTELAGMVKEKNNEITKLNQEEKSYENTISKLKKEEGKLFSDIEKSRNIITQLQKRIQEIIEEEAERMKKEKLSQEEEALLKRLSGDFEDNKGKLPAPVKNGVIVEKFGVHAHPVQTGLKIDNKGINITASNGSSVHAIYKGEVSKIFFFQGLNNSIMIRHGNYITVYSNLSEVNVAVGQQIATNQVIGKIEASDGSNGMLHFEIWKETTPQNPESWLAK